LYSLESWLKALIIGFREEAGKLSSDQRALLSNLDDFSFPCQVEIFWFQNNRFGIDFQLILCQHLKNRADLEVTVNGPIPFHKAVDELGKILANEKWNQELTSDEKYFIENGDRTIRRILEGEFLSTLEELRMYSLSLAFSESVQPVLISRKTYVTKESFAWFVRGNICLMEPMDIVKDIVGKSVSRIQKPISKIKSDMEVPAPEIKAYGTYFYPRIWIGEIPKRTFREKAKKQFFPKSREHFVAEYKDVRIIIQQDGLLAIAHENKMIALDMLNEIMGVALISGLPCFAIREPEVGEIKIEQATLAIKSSTMSLVSDRTRMAGQLGEPSYVSMIMPTTFLLTKEDIVELLNMADRIMRDAEIKKSIIFLLESYTHLQSSEYNQCFVMGWTVVERYIASLWDDFLKQRSITGKRRNKLRQGLLWTTDDIVESLNLAGSIDIQSYEGRSCQYFC